jgi:3-deoxy-D-manno-octulosonic-acid transferase
MTDYRIQKLIYNGVILPTVAGLARAASPFHAKLRSTFRGRRDIKKRWRSARGRMSERPVWFHVASVGEYEQARPLISALGDTRPEIPVAVSVTSPSGYRYITEKEDLSADNNIQFVDYLPVDFAANARFCLAALDPRLLVFVKFDLWPNLVWEAASRGTPAVLIDATLSETSQRFSGPGRRFYRAVYEDLRQILAISDSDAERFLECSPGHPGVSVVGDTRYDRVMERKRNRNETEGPRIDKGDRFTIVAGSTWPKDEVHLLDGLERLSRDEKNVLLIIAPHEPTEERVGDLFAWAESNHLRASGLSALGGTNRTGDSENVLIVDSVGVLAEVYRFGDIAYVGGSFSTGVHSVIEPAIMGIPVLFGPNHKNSFEAIELLKSGAAIEVHNSEDIHESLTKMLRDDKKRLEMGRRARSYVESQLGATERCLEAIQEYL